MENKLLENLNEGYNEEAVNAFKIKLDESCKKKDRLKGKIKKLQAEKAAMELLYKDTEILGKYLSIINELAELEVEDKETDKTLYDIMEGSGVELYEGKHCDIGIKHSYTKTQMNTKQFLQDFSPRTKMYQKYITIVDVRGNILIKEKKK